MRTDPSRAGEKPDPSSKILTPDEFRATRAELRRAGKTLVQCHGCFDLVHPGHVRHLRYGKTLGDVLLVTITGDAAINKGVGRPLIPAELRAENLAELDCVDFVVVEPRPTAVELLDEVRPDVYLKGQEYEFNNDPRFAEERAAVEKAGGRVVFSSGDVVFSSTALIQTLEASSADPFHRRLRQLFDAPEHAPERLTDAIARMRGQHVLVVGETIVDTYLFCDRPDIAGESPVMTLRPTDYRHFDGGAAIVARHAAALGAQVTLITPCPMDGPDADRALEMRRRLATEGIDVRPVPSAAPLPEKQRFLVGQQKVMKLDLVEPMPLDAAAHDALVVGAAAAARELGERASDGDGRCDAAIVCDFGLGLFTPRVLEALFVALRPAVRVLAGDVSGRKSSLRAMRGADLLCPSESEMRDAFQNFGEGLPAVAWSMLQQTAARAAIVSLGQEGMVGFTRIEGAPGDDSWASRLAAEPVPALAPHAVDALGCGDTGLTVAALAMASGAGVPTATLLASVGASLQAQRLGNTPVGSTDLRRSVERLASSHMACATSDSVAIAGRIDAASHERETGIGKDAM